MPVSPLLTPYPLDFPGQLHAYCDQLADAIGRGRHHDTRRHLFLNFLRVAFGIEPAEVELEHKVKVDGVRGRIDALYAHIIIEVKSDFDAEREDARRELKKYFASRPHPAKYIGLVTDGLRLEAWHLDRHGDLCPISETVLRADDPRRAWRWLDQFLSTGERLAPTSDELVARFGPESSIYAKAADGLLALYELVERDPLVEVKFREWNVLLAKVYGSALGKPALFVSHTYLTLVSRIIVTLALRGAAPPRRDLRGLLDGAYFSSRLNLRNLAEPDFFSWALDTPAEPGFLELLEHLFSHFSVYDFAGLAEDVLKNLYQGLVDPETRHDLGEYYTPDWLAGLTLERIGYRGGTQQRALDLGGRPGGYEGGRILDPACGSGGFLFAAVGALRAAGFAGPELVTHALENVIGLDVHPVAVLMAKANLLLALRAELRDYSDPVTLRVYMADALMTGRDASQRTIVVPVSKKDGFNIPLDTVERGGLDELIDTLSDFAKRGSRDEAAALSATRAADAHVASLPGPREAFWWKQNFRLLLRLDRERRNTIWAYILKNAYRPEFLRREKVDYVVGNPPWLSYRYIKDPAYKARVKELTFDYGLLGREEVKLFTQMDTATLFAVHCEREFLRPGGTLAMVLPKTVILPAKQHLAFQREGFSEVHDFSAVFPLFNVRTCLVIRRAPYGLADVPRVRWMGKLPERNLPLSQARQLLTSEEDVVSFAALSGEHSPYLDDIYQGATLVPRCLCFVEPAKDAVLNLKAPFVQTSDDAFAESKPEWRLRVEGKIEAKYLFGTLLSKDLMPFVVRKLSLAALPVVKNSHGNLNMINADEALSQGDAEAHDWFAQAETRWVAGRKSTKLDFAAWLNYTNKLTKQNLSADWIVLYNAAGTNLVASMLTRAEAVRIGRLPIQGFVVEHKTYRFYAVSENEAAYLVGVLNTAIVNHTIKPFQTQGIYHGERDIHRRPFEVCNIPRFDPADALHLEIAEVSAVARAELLPIVPKMTLPVAGARAAARAHVAGKLARLDALTRQLLGSAPARPRPAAPAPGDAQEEFDLAGPPPPAHVPEVMIPELSIVRLRRPLPEHELPAGTEGTIVHVYERGGYEVEFQNVPHPEVITLEPADVEAVWLFRR